MHRFPFRFGLCQRGRQMRVRAGGRSRNRLPRGRTRKSSAGRTAATAVFISRMRSRTRFELCRSEQTSPAGKSVATRYLRGCSFGLKERPNHSLDAYPQEYPSPLCRSESRISCNLPQRSMQFPTVAGRIPGCGPKTSLNPRLPRQTEYRIGRPGAFTDKFLPFRTKERTCPPPSAGAP